MLQKNIFFILFTLLLTSCTKDAKKNTDDNSYYLNISTEDNGKRKVYLQQLSNPSKIDSTFIENKQGIFKGSIKSPERYLVTIDGYFGGKMIVLENDSISVEIKNNDLINATISGSNLNNELLKVQKNSERIYNQIDALFPNLQRARLNNDVKTLQDISSKMSKIEQENIDYHFSYAMQYPDSFISAMILNDLSKRDSINIEKLSSIYNSLNENIKLSADAQKVSSFLSH